MIRLEAAAKTFRGPRGELVHALREVNLEVRAGEVLCLLGSSGCGKTTTLRLINRLERPTGGRVLVDGSDVAGVDPIRLRRGIGYVIQEGGLFPHLTVAENIGLLCRLEGWSDERRHARVDALLERVRLVPDAVRERYPKELSGGQRQRVGVARALALAPPVVLLDEPFGALDPITRGELPADFRELLSGAGTTVVLVTHDRAEAFRLGDRVALMHAGALVQLGTEAELRDAPACDFVRAFLAREAT